MQMELTFGSLFTGIGGLDLGLERAGWQCKWQVEIDEYCQKVLARHWPGIQRFSDVKAVVAADLTPVSLICGGVPCQDVSQAGRKVGLEGERSGLWSEYARIIGLLRPRFVLVENVPGLLARGFGRVLGDLAALGYDAEWACIPAAAVGAPHRRERVFIVAYPQGIIGNGGILHRANWLELQAKRQPGDHNFPALHAKRWEPLSPVSRFCRANDGIPYRIHEARLKALGNSVVPQIAEALGRLIRSSNETK